MAVSITADISATDSAPCRLEVEGECGDLLWADGSAPASAAALVVVAAAFLLLTTVLLLPSEGVGADAAGPSCCCSCGGCCGCAVTPAPCVWSALLLAWLAMNGWPSLSPSASPVHGKAGHVEVQAGERLH